MLSNQIWQETSILYNTVAATGTFVKIDGHFMIKEDCDISKSINELYPEIEFGNSKMYKGRLFFEAKLKSKENPLASLRVTY